MTLPNLNGRSTLKTIINRVIKRVIEIISDKIAITLVIVILGGLNLKTLEYIKTNINNEQHGTEKYLEKISQSLQTNKVINEYLGDLNAQLSVTNPSIQRVYVALFHNGVDTFSGLSFLKFSITNEVANANNVNTAYSSVQNLPLSIIYPALSILNNNECYIIKDTSQIKEEIFRDYFSRRSVNSAILCPIIVKKDYLNILDGITVAEFSSKSTNDDDKRCAECISDVRSFTTKIENFINVYIYQGSAPRRTQK